MIKINMPPSAEKIINKLYENGFEGYIVGGSVRDALLGRNPSDFDITTNALPEDVKLIFSKTVDTGIEHGTVTVIEDSQPYEVTTYRIDGEYKDNRRPLFVTYTKNIKDDLARRDFTVNALAYNHFSGIVDAFCGVEDLNKKIIRCVGEAGFRFSEDVLRVLRAIRFSAVLGFSIEEKTSEAIMQFYHNLNTIASERIYAEWKKLLTGKYAYNVIKEYYDVIVEILPELKNVKWPEKEKFDMLTWDERQMLLFALSSGVDGFEKSVKKLKMDSKTRDMSVCVLKNLTLTKSSDDNDIKLFVVGKEDETVLKCAKVSVAMGLIEDEIYEKIKSLIENDALRRINQLDVNGNDIKDLGIKGEKIGKALNEILRLAAIGKINNNKKDIVSYISENQEKFI